MVLAIALAAAFLYLFLVGACASAVLPSVRRGHLRQRHGTLSRSMWCCDSHYYSERFGSCEKCAEIQKRCPTCYFRAFAYALLGPIAIPIALPAAAGMFIVRSRGLFGWRLERAEDSRRRIAELEAELGISHE